MLLGVLVAFWSTLTHTLLLLVLSLEKWKRKIAWNVYFIDFLYSINKESLFLSDCFLFQNRKSADPGTNYDDVGMDISEVWYAGLKHFLSYVSIILAVTSWSFYILFLCVCLWSTVFTWKKLMYCAIYWAIIDRFSIRALFNVLKTFLIVISHPRLGRYMIGWLGGEWWDH